MAILTPVRHRFYNNDGTLAAGASLYTYEAGSTTLKTTYTNSIGGAANANTNPIILNSKGECDLWTTGILKINLIESGGAQITGFPVDNIGQGQSSYDINVFISGKPSNSQVILYIPMIRAITFDVNMNLSAAVASIAATASTTFVISKNGTQFGTLVFAISATTGIFSAAVPPLFAIGDILSITAPASADATLGNIGMILAASSNI